MTKHFCDLCGQPAVESSTTECLVSMLHPKLDLLYGQKLRAVFDIHILRRDDAGTTIVDICPSCKLEAVTQLMEIIKGQDTI